MKSEFKKLFSAKGVSLAISIILTLLSSSCRGNKPSDTGGEESASLTGAYRAVPLHETEDFHADNDIAMTIRSLADAIKVGEPLDSALYDFEGILTDGQGSPLYTDIQGTPGVWEIDVLDKKNVMIRNVYLGDLLTTDLQSYLLQSLHITEEQELEFNPHEAVNDDETEIRIFDFGGGYMRFEVRSGIAPNGLEGPMLSIIMSADHPTVAETHTNGLAQNGVKP